MTCHHISYGVLNGATINHWYRPEASETKVKEGYTDLHLYEMPSFSLPVQRLRITNVALPKISVLNS